MELDRVKRGEFRGRLSGLSQGLAKGGLDQMKDMSEEGK